SDENPASGDDSASDDDTERATDAESVIDGRWRDRLPADGTAVERPVVSLSDPHLFLHTGGSTGTPKETVIPHRSIYWNSFNTITAWGLRPDDTTPMTFPMFHTGGWNVITVPLFHLGGTVVIAREVDPGETLRLIDERDATLLIAVPAVLRAMADHDRWADTSLDSLRFVKSGGGPARSATMEAWWDRDVELSQGYGLTECGPNNFAMPDGWDRAKSDAVGVPAPHVDARIVDDDGRELPPGEIGELELSGPHAADRYWQRPTESRATFGPTAADASDDSTADAASWVSTGDLARVDGDGYYHVEGRKKNMFTSGGENVYPPEVEDAITDHPDVDEAVVIGVPDDRWGTVGKAVVAGADTLTLDALREFLDGRLARFKHPRALAHTDAIPTSGPSKIDREAVERAFGE
ncbi:MAG: AMP-binding protein, partial [Halobaculum sp.]